MKIVMYTIYDTVAEVFNKPFTAHNNADASRAFTQSFGDGGQSNKDDYVLYRIGEYNDATGEITPCLPLKVLSGFDIKQEAA